MPLGPVFWWKGELRYGLKCLTMYATRPIFSECGEVFWGSVAHVADEAVVWKFCVVGGHDGVSGDFCNDAGGGDGEGEGVAFYEGVVGDGEAFYGEAIDEGDVCDKAHIF